MTYGELPVGTEFVFGCINEKSYRGPSVKKEMKWVKVASDGRAMCERTFVGQMDAPRCATGNNRAVKTHGNKFFPKTYLRAMLNSQYRRHIIVPDGDCRPYFNIKDGFLSVFTEEELSVLEPFDTKYKVPDGYIKEFGKEYVDITYVSIPSFENLSGYEVGDELSCDSCEKFAYDVHNLSNRYNILTSSTGTMCYMAHCYSNDSFNKTKLSPSASANILPVIKIKEDTNVSQYENGIFYIAFEEKMLAEDILKLIGD